MGKTKKGGTGLDEGNFKWLIYNRVYSDISKHGPLEKRAGDRKLGHHLKLAKEWQPRYVVIHRNYLAYYKMGPKEGNGQPKMKDFPTGMINIGDCVPEQCSLGSTKDGYEFFIATKDRVYEFKAQSEADAKGWMTYIQELATKLRSLNKNDLGNIEAKIEKMKLVFPLNMTMPYTVAASDSDKWIANMVQWKAESEKWRDFAYEVQNYAEFYHGSTKAYIDWYSSLTGGVEAQLRETEEDVIQRWLDEIQKIQQDAEKAAKNKFFQEDVQKIVERCQNCFTLIKCYNKFKLEYRKDVGEEYQDLIPHLEKVLKYLSALPKTRAVNFNDYSEAIMGGVYLGEKHAWRYKHGEGKLKCETNEYVNQFDCTEAYQITSAHYGTIVWNNETWIWFHEKMKNQNIHFKYSPNTGGFKHILEETEENPHPPRYCNWVWRKNVMKAVTVNDDDSLKVPNITAWKVFRGEMPPALVLLVAIYQFIEELVNEAEGIEA